MQESAAMAAKRPLTQPERALLRRAVSQYYRWDSWRANVLDANGKPVNTSTISVDQLYAAAEDFGIDVAEAIAGAAAIEQRRSSAIQQRSSAIQQRTSSHASNGSIPATAASSSNDADQLAKVLQSILSRPSVDEATVRSIVADEVAAIAPAIDEATVQGMIDKALEGTKATVAIELTGLNGITERMEGHFHPQFPKLLKSVATKRNVWISGPTGTGKTHAARQVAEALSKALGRHIPFWYQGAMTQTHEFLGFVRPGDGVYQSTDLRQAFEFGGVCLLDECDSSDACVTLAIAGLLANGHAVFPDKPGGIPRHPDCYIMAAGNTWGTGATADFVGRNKLDAAFMSRFPIKLPWGYDEAFERSLYPGEFTLRVQQARKLAAKRGLKVIIDTRHMDAGSALVAAGYSMDEAAEMTYLAAMSDADRAKLAA
jgi:MoxR-like ATPase